jgi:4-aminobutyrate aminotransferase
MRSSRGAPVSSSSSRLAGDRPVPDLITEVPGPKARAHVAYDETWTSPSLPRAYPIVPVRGDGLTVEDIDGNLFLDFAAGIAVTSTGHSHPQVVGAIREQAGDLLHFSASDFYLPIYAQVCERIAGITPIAGGRARTYLGNSGAEVVEAAIKLARKATGRPNVVAFLGAFHGRTYGAVSLTASKSKYHAGFGPLLPGVYHAPFGRVEDLRWFDDVLFDKLTPADEVAAIIVEPIQGEGGYVVPEDGFLEGLRAICDRHGILLIADEIQSGAGRTGTMWAIEQWGVKPDILLTAKGIASGMPLGAMVARADLLERWGPGAHGSTYGGNPVACAAALATIDLLEGGLTANAAVRGEEALAGLGELRDRYPALVRDVRGRGLMIGVEFDTPDHAEEVQWAAFQRGLLVLECGKSAVRMSPALTVTADEMATALGIFGEAVAEVAGEGTAKPVLHAAEAAHAITGVESAI